MLKKQNKRLRKVKGKELKTIRKELSLSQQQLSNFSKKRNMWISRETIQKFENSNQATLRTVKILCKIIISHISHKQIIKKSSIYEYTLPGLQKVFLYKKDIIAQETSNKIKNNQMLVEECYLEDISSFDSLIEVKNLSNQNNNIVHTHTNIPDQQKENYTKIKKLIVHEKVKEGEEDFIQNILDHMRNNNIFLYGETYSLDQIKVQLVTEKHKIFTEPGVHPDLDERITETKLKIEKESFSFFCFHNEKIDSLRGFIEITPYERLEEICEKFNESPFYPLDDPWPSDWSEEEVISCVYNDLKETFSYSQGINKSKVYYRRGIFQKKIDLYLEDILKNEKNFTKKIKTYMEDNSIR